MLKKYLTIFNMNWQAGFAYPLSLFLWRFRQFLATIMSFTVWTVIFSQNESVFGYSKGQMTSYIFVIALLQGAVLSTSLHQLAGQLYSGELSQLFIKPVKLFRYFAALETADKLKNIIFVFFESSIIYFLFKPELIMPALGTLALFLLWVLGGILIHFFIEILFGTMGFWSPQTWGPKFVFFMLVEAIAGKLFPLDIMPPAFKNSFFLTPLPYLSYIQTQLFLHRLTPTEIVRYSVGLVAWTLVLGFLAHWVWNKGMKNYSAAGS